MSPALVVLLAVAAGLVAAGAHWIRQVVVLGRRHNRSKVVWSDFAAEELGKYYFPNSVNPGPYAVLDERGVRVIDFAKKPTIGKRGRQYVLVAIDQYGLGSWDSYLDGKERRHYEAVLTQADWLVENLTVDDRGVGVWLHHYDLGREYGVKAPWVSGLAQGMSISLLMRAHQASGDERYRAAAAQALRSFEHAVEDGGVRALDANGDAFYEEVPASPPQHILNGHVYALLGIHDYFRATRSPEARELFETGARALRTSLPAYDTGRWSRYSLNPRRTIRNHFTLASPLYHRLHVDMLRVLHAITGDPAFEEAATRWERYQGRPFDVVMRLAYVVFRDVVLLAKSLGLRP